MKDLSKASFAPLASVLVSLIMACDTTDPGKEKLADPVVQDSCAAAHNLDPKLILGRTKESIYRFGGLGDSIFWRTESSNFFWHEGKIDTFPGLADLSVQVPGIPYFWHDGEHRQHSIHYWDGAEIRTLDHPPADIFEFEFSGRRLVWTEGTLERVAWYFDGSSARKLESPFANGFDGVLSPKRVAWFAGSREAGTAVYVLENGEVRQIAPADGPKTELVVTDDIVAWIEGVEWDKAGVVKVYQDGEVKTVSDSTDMNSRLFAYGKRLGWGTSYLPPARFYYYDGAQARMMREYNDGMSVFYVDMNAKGAFLRLAGGFEDYNEWFDGSGFRKMGSIGSYRPYVSENAVYWYFEFEDDSAFGSACSDADPYLRYVMKEPL